MIKISILDCRQRLVARVCTQIERRDGISLIDDKYAGLRCTIDSLCAAAATELAKQCPRAHVVSVGSDSAIVRARAFPNIDPERRPYYINDEVLEYVACHICLSDPLRHVNGSRRPSDAESARIAVTIVNDMHIPWGKPDVARMTEATGGATGSGVDLTVDARSLDNDAPAMG